MVQSRKYISMHKPPMPRASSWAAAARIRGRVSRRVSGIWPHTSWRPSCRSPAPRGVSDGHPACLHTHQLMTVTDRLQLHARRQTLAMFRNSLKLGSRPGGRCFYALCMDQRSPLEQYNSTKSCCETMRLTVPGPLRHFLEAGAF